ncbi:MAG: MHS family MFS transporter [Alphaproteobacteria bacterium]|nr:MHS family MFS transporter [Alphaproteobacteria bacterium]
MTTAEEAAGGLSDTEHARQLRRAVVAGTVGTIIEAYDFLLYVQVAPLVFASLYFPSSDRLVGTLQAFGIYAVGFIARPVGAALFGHYGDRIGRKVTLITTLLLTGLSTFAVGFVPGYASIGIWGAVILTVVRFIQGMGIGGEWGGATLIAMEWAKTNAHRGFITSWPQWGGPAGLFLANLMVLLFSWVSGDQFLTWGWRVPFWLSIVMVAIGLYIRLGILETPTFRRIVQENRVERAPVLEVLRRQPRLIVLTALARMAEQGPFYIYAAFIFTYGTTVLHSSRNLLLAAVMCATALSAITTPLCGHISDRIGRKRMYLIGAVTMGVFGFVYFAMLNTAIPAVIFFAVILSFIPHDMMYGPQAALIAECFTPRLRYSGSSLGFHLSSVVAGGPAPLIATALFAATGSGYSVAIYIMMCAIVSVSATAFLPDYTNRDISQEDDYGTAPVPAISAVPGRATAD